MPIKEMSWLIVLDICSDKAVKSVWKDALPEDEKQG